MFPVWTLAIGTVLLMAVEPLPSGGTFFDDDGSVHEGSIEAIAAAGVTRGCLPPDLYCPWRGVTRGEMAAFLVRALMLPAATGDPFTDDDHSIFEDDIAALAAAGITRGCDPGRFCPEVVVTRGQMAAFLTRALGLPVAPSGSFEDAGSSPFAAEIDALAAAAITRGCDPPANRRFCPTEPVRRAEMASFLARGLGLAGSVGPPRPHVTLSFTGDVLIHPQVSARATGNGRPFDFGPMFAPVAGVLSETDIAICHLEVPLSEDNRNLSGYPVFNAPRQVAEALASAGYEGCSTASNHSFDRGEAGIRSTLSVLDHAGLGQAGMSATEVGAGVATLYRTPAATVAHLSATWWLNGFRLPPDKPWLVQLVDVPALLAQAEAARAEGADVVVVSIHCCVEYLTAPTAYQRQMARALIASPAIDLVVGHHAHVVQPVEEVDGEYIIYGLGNFLSAQRSRPATQDGVIVTVEMAARGSGWSARGVEAHPIWVEFGTYRILPAIDHNRSSWSRTAAALHSMDAPGLTVRR